MTIASEMDEATGDHRAALSILETLVRPTTRDPMLFYRLARSCAIEVPLAALVASTTIVATPLRASQRQAFRGLVFEQLAKLGLEDLQRRVGREAGQVEVAEDGVEAAFVERGEWRVTDAVAEQPWLPNGPIDPATVSNDAVGLFSVRDRRRVEEATYVYAVTGPEEAYARGLDKELTAPWLIKEASRATPKVMPVWRMALVVADAIPERSRGTRFMTKVLHAGTDKPMPMPSTAKAKPAIQ